MDPEDIKKEVAALAKKHGLDEHGGHGHNHDHGHGHDHHHSHGVPDELKEVTAILLRMQNTQTALLFSGEFKKGFKAQAVNPIIPMRQLMDNFVGNIRKVLLALTSLIIVVSGVGIFVSIYNSMADRRKEIAIMRALGAGRQTVFAIVLMESILLCVGGGLLGILMGHGLVFLAVPLARSQIDLVMNPWRFQPQELILLPVLIVLASLIGFIPGMTAYRTDVARSLAD
jgi:putative ABC transport system permease protein